MSVEKTFLQELTPSAIEVYQYLEWPVQEGIDRLRVTVQGIRDGSLEDQSRLGLWDRFVYCISGVALLIPPTNFVIAICMRNLGMERVSDEPLLPELYPEKNSEISPRAQNRPSPESERWLHQVHQMHDPHRE